MSFYFLGLLAFLGCLLDQTLLCRSFLVFDCLSCSHLTVIVFLRFRMAPARFSSSASEKKEGQLEVTELIALKQGLQSNRLSGLSTRNNWSSLTIFTVKSFSENKKDGIRVL